MPTEEHESQLDPVCGRPVDPASGHAFTYRRRTYRFCSATCRGRFERNAERHRLHDLARMGALFTAEKVRWGQA